MQSRVLRGTLSASQSRRRHKGPHARWRLHAAALGMLLLAGCGRSTVQIEASFRLDGKPLDDAGVSFVRIDAGGRMAAGITDAQSRTAVIQRNSFDFRIVELRAGPPTRPEELPRPKED